MYNRLHIIPSPPIYRKIILSKRDKERIKREEKDEFIQTLEFLKKWHREFKLKTNNVTNRKNINNPNILDF